MTYQQKMTHHLRMAETLGAEVDSIEAKALANLGLSTVSTSLQAYRVKSELEPNNLHRQRANARDLHLRLATAYGIAALVEEAGRGQATRGRLNRP